MATLGHTRLSWDNEKEKQPDSEDTAWAELTRKEQAAAVALGYTAAIWDNESGSEEQPTSADKYFAELESCGECLVILHDLALYPQGGGTEQNAHATYRSRTLAVLPGCISEQAAARALGFTQASWDNGEEPLGDTNWCGLTHEQRVAGVKLGYTEASWDNLSGKEPQPASDDKFFAELKSCGAYSLHLHASGIH